MEYFPGVVVGAVRFNSARKIVRCLHHLLHMGEEFCESATKGVCYVNSFAIYVLTYQK